MGIQRLVVALLASFAVFWLWMFIASRVWPPPPPRPPTSDTVQEGAGGGMATTKPSGRDVAASRPEGEGDAEVSTSPVAARMRAVEDEGAQVTKLGGAEDDSPFPMELTIEPVGAAVREVLLRDHKDDVRRKTHEPRPYPILEPVESGVENAEFHSFASTEVRISVDDADYKLKLDDKSWSITRASEETVECSLPIMLDGAELAVIRKVYHLAQQSPASLTSDLNVSVNIENRSATSFEATLVQRGPIGLKREDIRSDFRSIMSAAWTGRGIEPDDKGHLRSEIMKHGTLKLAADRNDEKEGDVRLGWVVMSNKYFACAVAPSGRTGNDQPRLIAETTAVHLTEIRDDRDRIRQDLTFNMVTVPLSIAPGGTAELALDCYIGAKAKAAFNNVEQYAQREYIEMISANFYACAPTAIVWFMMWLLDVFKMIVVNYGLAIIVLVAVVRTVLHPITKKSQINMSKMQKEMSKLQPKLQAVKQKYANDPAKQRQAMMEVYQEEGVNPAGSMLSCIPMFLQLPIWAALWAGLNFTVEIRHAPFDGWWIKDLTAPDALYIFSRPLEIWPLNYIMSGPIHSLNLLPVLLAITQMLQMKYMPRTTPTTADGPMAEQMERQRKMMMFFSVFFMFILYNAPSGLNLYIMASNIFVIFEQRYIRKHLAELEEKEKSKPAVAKGQPGPRRKNWIQAKWEELQKRAEEARRQPGGRQK